MAEQPGEINPYAAPQAPLDRGPVVPETSGGFRSATPIARWIVGLLAVFSLIHVLQILNDVVGISTMNRLLAGADVGDGEISGLNGRSSAAATGSAIIYLATAVLFCVFMPRANRNARALSTEPLQFTPGMAAGVFFIPIWGLYKPYQAMKELWQLSDPAGRPALETPVPPIVGWWWGLYLVSGFAQRVLSSAFKGTLPPNEYISRCEADIFMAALFLAAAVCAALVVRGVARRQDERAAGPAAAGAVPPPPGLMPAGGLS